MVGATESDGGGDSVWEMERDAPWDGRVTSTMHRSVKCRGATRLLCTIPDQHTVRVDCDFLVLPRSLGAGRDQGSLDFDHCETVTGLQHQ